MINVYVLKDMSDGVVDAVIISKKSTKEDIEKAISKAKQNDAYTWEDILEAIPSDCDVYDNWDNNVESIYY